MHNAASSVGRVMQPYHFTIMLVVVQVLVVFHVAHTSSHHLLFGILQQRATLFSTLQKKCYKRVRSSRGVHTYGLDMVDGCQLPSELVFILF
jgi:hypothetical protein